MDITAAPGIRFQNEALPAPCEAFARRWLPALESALAAHVRSQGGPRGVFGGALEHLLLGRGKRFRPLLALAACELVGGDAAHALDVACAIECVHKASQVLDDLPCMDDAVKRSGQAALHRAHGEATAILASLALFSLAFELLARDGGQRSARMCRVLSHALGAYGISGGQQLDLLLASRPELRVDPELVDTRLQKTYPLIVAALVMGAMCGPAEEPELASLHRFGEMLGRAYQLVDDNVDLADDGPRGCCTPARNIRDLGETAVATLHTAFPAVSGPRIVLEDLARVALGAA